MASYFYHIFVLCSIWTATSYGSLTMKMLKDRDVIITGPQDVTVFMRSSDKIIVAWTLPEVYVPHDASDDLFEKLKNGDQIGVLKPMFSFEPHEVAKVISDNINNVTDAGSTTVTTGNSTSADETVKPTNPAPSEAPARSSNSDDKSGKDSGTTAGTGNNSTSAPAAPSDADADTTTDKVAGASTQAPTKQAPSDRAVRSVSSADEQNLAAAAAASLTTSLASSNKAPINLNHIRCQALTSFADYTVGEKKPEAADNGWAVSLLESNLDIPVTNMSNFYLKEEHKLVKFEEGCVSKFVVTYSRQDSRPEEKQIVLNATDHLVTIDNLKTGADYKIVVTAHFISGDAISADAIYVTTLRTGVICRCDWHGTKNHTSDCESPSATEQHCDCNDAYKGRFCRECADGFYRDSLGDGCKKCPCGEHGGVQSSCRFVQGFLTCDKCAKGYTGTICHKCDNGYYRFMGGCRECLCHGNAETCKPSTGMCLDCQYNTTGFFCERCLPKHIRYPNRHTGSCYDINDVGGSVLYNTSPAKGPKKSSSSGISSGVIGAIIFVIVLCVCVVVGLCVIRRVRANRQRRALWTVEMRPDNDDLDFNSVHNEDARMDQVDDMAFYDRQTGRSKTGSKYSRLTEEC